jgi:hypothetical protein
MYQEQSETLVFMPSTFSKPGQGRIWRKQVTHQYVNKACDRMIDCEQSEFFSIGKKEKDQE